MFARVFFLGPCLACVRKTEKRGGTLQSFYLLQLSHWLGHIMSRSKYTLFYLFILFFYAFILQCVSHKVQTGKVPQHDISARAVLLRKFLDTGEGRSANARDRKKKTLHVKAHTDDLTPKYRTGAPFM